MRRLTTLVAAALLTGAISACQLLPFAPSAPDSDGQSPPPPQSPGAETFGPTTDPFETVPASIDLEPASAEPVLSPSIEIPPPID